MSRQILEIVRGEIFPIDKFLPLINFQKKNGVNWELNPGPPAPKAGIIPLDH